MSHEPTHGSEESSTNIGKWMIVGLWVLLLAFGTYFAQKWLDKRHRGQIPTNVSSPDGRLSVQLDADQLGHYIVLAQVNGQPVTFLVDTGASGVSIPSKIAEKLGLEPGLAYPVSTANGDITVRSTNIDKLSIGQIGRENVRASINSSMDGQIGLLGMTFLRHFELFQRDGILTIREP